MLEKDEIEFLKKLGLKMDFEHLTEDSDEWADIEECVGDELMYEGLDDDYAPNEIGKMCRRILNKLP